MVPDRWQLKAPETSEWPGHYSATTNNSPQDKESFVTGALLTNSMHCVIKLASMLFPLCDTQGDDSPQCGKPRGGIFCIPPTVSGVRSGRALDHKEVAL